MSRKIYIGIESASNVVTKIYVGECGIARAISKAYIGTDGVSIQIFPEIRYTSLSTPRYHYNFYMSNLYPCTLGTSFTFDEKSGLYTILNVKSYRRNMMVSGTSYYCTGYSTSPTLYGDDLGHTRVVTPSTSIIEIQYFGQYSNRMVNWYSEIV